MTNRALATTLFLIALPAAAQAPVADAVEFAPVQGAQLEKRFQSSLELRFDELTSTMNGQEVPPEFLPEMDLLITDERSVVVLDEYVAVAGGRPRNLLRTFREITVETLEEFSMEPDIESSERATGSSELVDETLRFVAGSSSDDYARSFTERVGGDELLAGLVEDMDLRAILPDGAVEKDDTWEVDANFLHALQRPGGNLSIELDDGEKEEWGELEFSGGLKATLAGFRTGDGQGEVCRNLPDAP